MNFRGYPGSTTIPTCEDTRTDHGKVTRVRIPCFSDPRGTKKLGGEEVTVYTVNQGIVQWHVLYAWERDGGLSTVSEHVVAPLHAWHSSSTQWGRAGSVHWSSRAHWPIGTCSPGPPHAASAMTTTTALTQGS